MSFAIKTEFIYGWDFTEFEEDEDGDRVPIIYDTKEEADKELEFHIKCVNSAYKAGHMDSPYENDCKVFNLTEEL